MTPALALGTTGEKLALRPYQETTLANTFAALDRGVRRQLWVLATGLGKTVGFVALAERMGVRTLILAHRDELISQAVAKVRMWWPDADVGVVKAERNEVGAQDVVVASIQSLSPARLRRLGGFGLVIVDEAHHCGAASYGRVLEALRAGAPDGPVLLGVTATPDRADGKGLDAHFDEITANYDLLWGIRAGYLTDIRAIEVKMTNLRLEDVKISRGDYAEGALGEAMHQANAPWWIVKAWKAHAGRRPTAVFTPTIANAEEVAAEFMANGIAAATVSGVDLDTRRRVLRAFEAGQIQVVTNAAVLTEGWDCPSLSCIVAARPTRSRGLFTQIVGRGTRPHPGKEDLLLLDLVGASEKVDLCSVATLAGVPKAAMKGRTMTEAIEKVAEDKRRQLAATPRPRIDADMDVREVALFKKVADAGRVAWARTKKGAFAVSAGPVSVLLEPTGDDAWTVVTVDAQGVEKVLMAGMPLSLVQGIADDYVRNNAPEVLSSRFAGWRKKRPTAKQLETAARWRITVDAAWNAGEVSAAIGARIAEARLSQARQNR